MEIQLQAGYLLLSPILPEVGNPCENTRLAFSQGRQTCVTMAGSEEAGTVNLCSLVYHKGC